MQLNEIRRRVVIEGSTVGVDESTRKMVALGKSQDEVSESSDRLSRSTKNLDGAYDKTLATQRARIELMERERQSWSQRAVEYAAVAASVLAAGVAVSSFFDKVVELNRGLAQMQAQAKAVGLTMADLQGIKLGGAIAGIPDADINAGLQRSAQLLNDASRNANTLSKELAENGISIRQSNGQMITQNQLLGIAADLIRRARNPGDQSAIAEMLGFTRSWIPLLEQGAGAMAGLTDEARRAGAVISDETIERASEFDRKWRKSGAEFSAYMKAAALEFLPLLDDLIDRAAMFVKTFDAAAVEKASKQQLKGLADALDIPDEAAFKFELPQNVLDNWKTLGDETKSVIKAFAEFDVDESVLSRVGKLYNMLTSMPTMDQVKGKIGGLMPSVSMVPQQDMKWLNGTSPVIDTDATIQSAKNAAAWDKEGAAWTKLSATVVAGAGAMEAGYSRVAASAKAANSNDAYDRALEAVSKHTARIQADTMAVGLGAGAQEEFRARLQLTTAAKLADREITAKLTDEIEKQAKAAGAAGLELAKMRIANQIKFDRDTIGLSPEDVQIARTVAGIYDNDIPKALASSEAETVRLNSPMSALREQAKPEKEADRDSDLRRQAA